MDLRLTDILLAAANMLVTFLFLRALVFKPVAGFLDKRAGKISRDIEDAAAVRKDAETMRDDCQNQLSQAGREAEEIISQTRLKAGELAETMRVQAKTEADEIIARAKEEACEQASLAAQGGYRQLVDLSASLASRILEREVTVDDNDRMAREFFEKATQ